MKTVDETFDDDLTMRTEHPANRAWMRRGVSLLGAVRGGGALGHVPSPPFKWGAPLPPLRHDLDWIVYVPEVDANDANDVVVLALRARDFFRDLAAHDAPWFTAPGAGLGRLVDLLRDPPASERR